MNKKIYLILLIIFFYTPLCFSYDTINSAKNAYRHNNKGLAYLEEKYYFGAIKEFQIAISLNPKSQASAAFYINLGTTYEKIGYNELAKDCFEKALALNPLYFDSYLKLAQNYKKSGIAAQKLTSYQNNKKLPLSDVMIGLLYIQTGQVTTGITVLDDFVNKEENLILSSGVKEYLKTLTETEDD